MHGAAAERGGDRPRPSVDLAPVAAIPQLGRDRARHLFADEPGVVGHHPTENDVLMHTEIGGDLLHAPWLGRALKPLGIALVLADGAA